MTSVLVFLIQKFCLWIWSSGVKRVQLFWLGMNLFTPSCFKYRHGRMHFMHFNFCTCRWDMRVIICRSRHIGVPFLSKDVIFIRLMYSFAARVILWTKFPRRLRWKISFDMAFVSHCRHVENVIQSTKTLDVQCKKGMLLPKKEKAYRKLCCDLNKSKLQNSFFTQPSI